MEKIKVLYLTLKKQAFEVMVTGEKVYEYRKNSEWIKNRLIDYKTGKEKQYDVIKFVNGYGNHRPYFVAEYKGFLKGWTDTVTFSNGLKVNIEPTDFIIRLGKIGMRKNLELLK